MVMHNFVIEAINQYGYWGVGFLMLLENIILLIPSELILAFGGFATTNTGMNVWGVILAATAGSLSSAVILYSAGRFLKPACLEQLLARRIGRLLRLQPEAAGKANDWFARHGNTAVFLCRFVPVIRCLISLPAGSARIPFGVFLALTAAGTVIWNTVLVWFGVLAGKSWHRIVYYMHTYTTYALLAAGLMVGIAVIYYRQKARRHKMTVG